MATDLSTDLYDIYGFTKDIQNEFTDISEDALMLSTFGYLAYNFSKILQNALIVASEYSNEAIPTKAKFAKNVIAHSLALGIDDINATPSYIRVLMAFPKDKIEMNLKDNIFIFDKDIPIYIGEYEFHTDYDIILTKHRIEYNNITLYSAKYDPDQMRDYPNPVSDITSEYLPSVAESYIAGIGNMLFIPGVTIRQIQDEKTYRKIMTDNPIENKTLTFEFENQLAGFNVEVKDSTGSTILTPVYDGLYDYKNDTYCNYMYLNTNTIRVKFNADSYTPKINADITVHAKTTKGSAGNFTFSDEIVVDLTSDKIAYDDIYTIIKPAGTATVNGEDSKSISELKKIIPKEALARGTITTSTDLENFFNSLNNDKVRLYFKKKIHNHITHSFYAYLLMKNSNNQVIPTHTLDSVKLVFNDDDKSDPTPNKNIFIVPAGSVINYNEVDGKWVGEWDRDNNKEGTFKYITPFSMLISSNPTLVEYMLDIIDISKYTLFDFVNQNSLVQFVASSINWTRGFINEDRYKYTMKFTCVQNVNIDLGLIPIQNKQLVSENGLVVYDGDEKMKIFLVLYNEEDIPLVYIKGNIVEEGTELEFTDNTTAVSIIAGMRFEILSDGKFNSNYGTHIINDENNPNIFSVGTISPEDNRYVSANMKAKIFIYGNSPVITRTEDGWKGQTPWDGSYGRPTSYTSSVTSADMLIPNMSGYTLYNIYEIEEGLDFLYDYSHIINSTADSISNSDGTTTVTLRKVPLVGYDYIMGPDEDSEKADRMNSYITELELRRIYIDYCLLSLEGGMEIDLKFFNTYGPSVSYWVSEEEQIDRTNLTFEFNLKLLSNVDKTIIDNIIENIKDYIENIDEIKSLHMPNLVTEITTAYRDKIEYFEFVKFNDYGPKYQHIYTKEDDEDIDLRTPEFLCIQTKANNEPEITINLK